MKRLLDLFNRKPRPQPGRSSIKKVLQAVSMTDEAEISCDDVYALLDQFTEMVKRGKDAAHLMPLVQKHLDMCPDCREEFETLLKMMNASE